MSKRSAAGLVRYVKFLVEAGVMDRPVWLDVLERVPPPNFPKVSKRPPELRYPEDDIVKAYYKRHPEACLEPVDLGSFKPSTARRFAYRQLELMESGLPRKQAKEQTEREFLAESSAKGEGGIIETIQKEEENHLQQALQTYTERHGHVPRQFKKGKPL